jgi:2-polyprenyl-3-methyl-5-hydroxy-6-metoxy-1,4-benzoquinol methylase
MNSLKTPMQNGKTIGRALGWSIRTTDRVIHKAAHSLGRASPGSEEQSIRRAKEHQVGETYSRGGISVVHRGFLSMSLMRSLELNMCWPVLDQLASPILDIGCGNGIYAQMAFRKNQVLDGIDIDQRELTLVQNSGVYRSVYFADASQHIPGPTGIYQSVFSNSVFEHIPNVQGVIREVSRVISPSGVFVFTTYNPRLTEYMSSCFGWQDAKYMNKEWSHTTLMALEQYETILKQNGFGTIHCSYYLTTKAVRVLRLLSSRVIEAGELLLNSLLWQIMRKMLWSTTAQALSSEGDESAGMLIVAQKKP